MFVREFHGIRPVDSREGLRNPDRGLRTESLVAEIPEKAFEQYPVFHLKGKVPDGYCHDWWLQDMKRYEQHGLTLVQAYCYLNEYLDDSVSDEKITWLEEVFALLRENGYKAILRFAYESGREEPTVGPTMDDIRRHMKQLKPVLQRNEDVIFLLQAGLIGIWGEWHTSANELNLDASNLAECVELVLDALPSDKMTQVRVPKRKRQVLEEGRFSGPATLDADGAHRGTPVSRIGFHNDGFLAYENDGFTWPEPPHFAHPGNPEYDYMTAESPYLLIDGEMFWSDLGGEIDGFRAAESLRRHHYTSFSLAHGYSEREGKPFSIDKWMCSAIDIDDLRKNALPISDGYFQNAGGQPVERTYFEYIRDHLGYRLELQSATFPEKAQAGESIPVQIELINRGFSTLHNKRPFFLVLFKEDAPEDMHVIEVEADPRSWQPFLPEDSDFKPLSHQIVSEISLASTLSAGKYQMGVWLPDLNETLREDARYAVRFANRDVPFWNPEGRYGINLLGALQIYD